MQTYMHAFAIVIPSFPPPRKKIKNPISSLTVSAYYYM